MIAIAADRAGRTGTNPASNIMVADYPDPLEDDHAHDEVVVTTRRGVLRVALVATEVASRFQREGMTHDPMAWMLAPRRLFGGAAAIDACTERAACLRSVLLHGLSLGLDVDAEVIDSLVAPGELGNAPQIDCSGDAANVVTLRPARGDPPRLYTATLVWTDGARALHAFHASLAADEDEIVGRLYSRIGTAAEDARIVLGFDVTDPLVNALVAPPICDMLELVASDPGSPLAAGLDLNVEQRFVA